MNRRRWYYKNGTCFEEFDILFDNGRFMLVQNVETKVFSFGVCENFGTLYGFPVNWSCLTKDQAIERLNNMIRIDIYRNFHERGIQTVEDAYTCIERRAGNRRSGISTTSTRSRPSSRNRPCVGSCSRSTAKRRSSIMLWRAIREPARCTRVMASARPPMRHSSRTGWSRLKRCHRNRRLNSLRSAEVEAPDRRACQLR